MGFVAAFCLFWLVWLQVLTKNGRFYDLAMALSSNHSL